MASSAKDSDSNAKSSADRASARTEEAAATTPESVPALLALRERLGNQGFRILVRKATTPRDDSSAQAQAGLRTEMSRTFGMRFDEVRLSTDEEAARRASQLGTDAYTDGRQIGFAPGAYEPSTPAGRRRIAHEFAHVAQVNGGNTGGALPPIATPALAEWQAERAAAAAAAGYVPRVSAYVGARRWFCNGPEKGPGIATTNDEEALALVLNILVTAPEGEQRRGAISFLAGLAVKKGPAQTTASERLIKLLAGDPNKDIADHMAAVSELRNWTATDVRAYDLLLYGRLWFADRSKDEIGSGLVVDAFRKYLHYDKGKWAIAFLRSRIAGEDKLKANLAGRIVADLLETENEPSEKIYAANYAALRAMARANGWESFGPLGAASATPRIFSALEAARQQADTLERMIRLGPIADQWEDADVARLTAFSQNLGRKGVLKGTSPQGTPTLSFSAENREETEHELLSQTQPSTTEWLQEMARSFTLAVDAGVRLQERTAVLHENALALEQFMGKEAGRASDERKALFDLRHEYIEAWLSVFGETFSAGQGGRAENYQARLDLVEQRFQNFDRVVAQRKFQSARDRFSEYTRFWRDGKEQYPGNDKMDEKFFFTMRDVLEREKKSLDAGYALAVAVPMSSGVMLVLEKDIPTDLRQVAALDRDTSIFGLQSALFLLYATNLSVHNMMLKADVGSASFQAEQGKRLGAMRAEMEAAWNTGELDGFIKKVDGYQQSLKEVMEKIKDRAKLDFLLNLVITLVAALLTEGAALVVRVAALSEMLALARTARAISAASTLFEVGVFTASQLSLQKAIFGKDIGALGVIKTAATNLAFVGALKAIGKLAEPFSPTSPVRQLLFAHLIGFSGVAAVSATMTRIETGQWPPDMALFLAQTAMTYLLIVGMHRTFQELAAKPALTKVANTRFENLSIANEALKDTLQARVESGRLTRPEFEAIRAERLRLLEETRAVAQVLRDAAVISPADMASVNKMADNAVADAQGASFPLTGTGEPAVLALPAPESVSGLTRAGESNTYMYDPSKPSTGIDTMLARYKERGYTVQGSGALVRVVDPSGRTRFLLTGAPVPSTRFLLPFSGGIPVQPDSALARATGLGEPQLSAVRDALAKVHRDAETKLAAEYPDHTVLATLALLVEQASVIAPNWPIDAVRGVADALALERGIPRSAVRRLFLAVDPKALPALFAAFHDIVNSPKVSAGNNYLIADDLLPKNSVKLIDAYRELQKLGLELPADMDLRATRGLLRQVEKMPGTWSGWLAAIAKDKRGEKLRAVSGLTDPRVRLPENITEVLAYISADIPGQPGLNPLAGADGEAFVKDLETRAKGRFSTPDLRLDYIAKVNGLRLNAATLQQASMARGEWENIVGRANEVRQTAMVLLSGATILVSDREVGPKGPLPSIDLAAFALPGGGKVANAPKQKDVHIDVLFTEASGALAALELTTAELSLPEPCAALDPKNPAYGGDVDFGALDPKSATHRKFIQALKLYALNKMATALGTAWSGQPVNPASIRIRAGDFSAPAARALEDLGFQLERNDGTRVTAAQIEARKASKPAAPATTKKAP